MEKHLNERLNRTLGLPGPKLQRLNLLGPSLSKQNPSDWNPDFARRVSLKLLGGQNETRKRDDEEDPDPDLRLALADRNKTRKGTKWDRGPPCHLLRLRCRLLLLLHLRRLLLSHYHDVGRNRLHRLKLRSNHPKRLERRRGQLSLGLGEKCVLERQEKEKTEALGGHRGEKDHTRNEQLPLTRLKSTTRTRFTEKKLNDTPNKQRLPLSHTTSRKPKKRLDPLNQDNIRPDRDAKWGALNRKNPWTGQKTERLHNRDRPRRPTPW